VNYVVGTTPVGSAFSSHVFGGYILKITMMVAIACLIASPILAHADDTKSWCRAAVEEADRSFQQCSSMGSVIASDGTPGAFGVGCTLDHVLAFANAYADLLHCAMKYHDPGSIRELRDLRNLATTLSSPAAQRHLNDQP
jgi:hypothetical protein